MNNILIMFISSLLQSGSFTLVSRARNSNSIFYHTIASILSNSIWLFVIRNIIINFDNLTLMVTYLIGSVIGGVGVQFLTIKFFENKK